MLPNIFSNPLSSSTHRDLEFSDTSKYTLQTCDKPIYLEYVTLVHISKVLICCVIRRIYVYHFYLAFVCLFKQLQGCEVVALDEKVHLTIVVDEKAAVLGQDGRMGRKHLVDFLAVFLKDKTVFFAPTSFSSSER